MRRMMHRRGAPRHPWALLVAAFAGATGCARGAPSASAPAERIGPAGSAPAVPLNPRAVGSMTLLSLRFPESGEVIGGHYEGRLYQARVATLEMADGTRLRLTNRARAAGETVLRAAGFSVIDAPARSSDAEPLTGVRFGLEGRVALRVRTIGQVAPLSVVAGAVVTWDLLDLASGTVVFTGESQGGSELPDSLELAVTQAVSRAFDLLLADRGFQAALVAPRVRSLEDVIFSTEWQRPPPELNDTVWIAPDAMLASAEPEPAQRVAAGVMTVHGRRGLTFTAFTLSRDGLALTREERWENGPYFGRFHDGVDRPLRVLRVRNGLSLIEVRCEDPCFTVPWNDTAAVRHSSPVFVVAGPPARGQPYWVGHGRVTRSGVPGIWMLALADAEGGEPVARRDDGAVFAISAGREAITIPEALRRLGVAIRPAP